MADQPKVGADALESILSLIASFAPGIGDVVAIVEGVLKIVPGAVSAIEQIVADFKGKQASPILPQVEADVQAVTEELSAPLTAP